MKPSVIVTVVLVLAPVLSSAQEDLGRLFFTAEQRQALDAGKRIVVKGVAKDSAPQAKTKTEDVALRGVVTRSDGERTVWINDKAYHNNSPKGVGVKIRPANPATAEISIGTSKKSIPVRVGEQLDGETGTVRQHSTREAKDISPSSAKSNLRGSSAQDNNPREADSGSDRNAAVISR